jgi:ABC-type antimicrobial peptide transport system permease subunit
LSSILGVVAFLLTITGIYGVMSYAVNQRTKEIGIRMALGATPGSIARLVLAYSARLTGAGLVCGTILAMGVLQYSASKIELAIDLYDIPAYSWSLIAVTGAAMLAGLGPVRRACQVDPQEAVRAD